MSAVSMLLQNNPWLTTSLLRLVAALMSKLGTGYNAFPK